MQNARFVIGFVINWHKKRCEVFKMTLAAQNPAILRLYKAKTQSFLTGEAAIPKDLPFFHEMKKCWNQA